MRLLVTTQVLDARDPNLSFFVGWVREFAKHFKHIEVICLKEGLYELPDNVRVRSLGKEKGVSRATYLFRFFRYVWAERKTYDAVFVHMNQEYVLLGGLLWKLLRKPIFLWRNHYRGSWMTDLAARFAVKVFCTSRFSYTARYPHTVLMPVGVDTRVFRPLPEVERKRRSVLFLGRFSSSKRPDLLLEALAILAKRGVDFSASFYGDPGPADISFHKDVKARAAEVGLAGRAIFHAGIRNADTVRVYNSHEIFVDLGASGMYNKTLFEAAASGCLVLAVSEDFAREMGERYQVEAKDPRALAAKIEACFTFSDEERKGMRQSLRSFAEQNSLETLALRLAAHIV
jgi:glycosyltransferase involved in cell wall biosynthesis